MGFKIGMIVESKRFGKGIITEKDYSEQFGELFRIEPVEEKYSGIYCDTKGQMIHFEHVEDCNFKEVKR